jgi:hypothetical protein
VTEGKPVWSTPVGRRPLLVAAGAIAGAAALPGRSAQAATGATTRVAAATVDAIAGGTWLAGDTHVHDDHSSDGSFIRQIVSQEGPGTLSVGDQIGEGERIGLDWMPLTDHRTYDQHWDPQWTSSALLLVPGEEANGSPHATCIGAVDVVVDGIRPPGSAPHRHVQQSIWEAHAQGAAWGIAHPGDTQAENDSVIGATTVETWNRASEADVEVDWAENAWNNGFRFGAAGACDCHFKELWGVAGPGMPTTWVFAKAQTERAVLTALRAGRTTVSSSPVGAFVTIEADADGDGIFEGLGGDELTATGSSVTLRVRVQRAPGMQLLVYEAPGRSSTPLLDVVVKDIDETHTITAPMPMSVSHRWWRAEVRADGPPSGMTTNPQADIPKQADQLQAMTSAVFANRGTPAVPQPAIALPALSGSPSGAVVDVGGTDWHGFPDVAVNNQGTHVVCEDHDNGETAVVYTAPNGNRWVVAGGGARLPKVVAAGDDVWIAYQQELAQLPRNPQIWLRHIADAGATRHEAVRLSDGRGRQERPAIALLPDGRPVVAWQAATGSAVEVLAWTQGETAPAVLSLAGKVIKAPTPDDSRSARYPASLFPDIAVLPDAVVVSWQDNRNDVDPGWTGHNVPARAATEQFADNDPSHTLPDLSEPRTDPDGWEPMVSVRPLGASAWSTPIRVAPGTGFADCHPAVGATAEGVLVCAWDSRELKSSGTSPVIRTATSLDRGQTWTAPVDVDVTPRLHPTDPPTDFSQRPRLATDPDGRLRMVWYDARGTDWRWAVRTAVLQDGTWQPEGEIIRGGSCTWPAIDNGVVVATTDRASTAQRDLRQDIVLARVAGAPDPVVPEIPMPVVLPVLAAGLTAVLTRGRRRAASESAS